MEKIVPPKIQFNTILEKGTSNQNEDYLVAEENIFGVFDGATSLDRSRFEQDQTGGMIASHTAASVFRKNHYPLTRLASQANDEIMQQMVSRGVDVSQKENLWSTSAAVVRLKEDRLEWVQTGDAVILLIYEDGSYKALVDRDDQDHETLSMWQNMVSTQLKGHDQAPEDNLKLMQINGAMASQIRKVRMGMNVTYGVLNGEKAAEEFLNHGEEPLDRVSHLLIFTDGLTIPSAEVENKKDFTPLVDTYLNVGLDGLKEVIRQKEEQDPHCLTFPRFKCHDDIAAIAVSFEAGC